MDQLVEDALQDVIKMYCEAGDLPPEAEAIIDKFLWNIDFSKRLAFFLAHKKSLLL